MKNTPRTDAVTRKGCLVGEGQAECQEKWVRAENMQSIERELSVARDLLVIAMEAAEQWDAEEFRVAIEQFLLQPNPRL